MRTDLVVMGHPLLDHNLGFESVSEPLDRQAFIAELSVEALGGSVLPGLAWIDQGCFDLVLRGPPQKGRSHELRTVVAAQEGRCSAGADDSVERIDHLGP